MEKYQAPGCEYPMADYKNPEREKWEKDIHNLVKMMEGYGGPAAAGSTKSIQTEAKIAQPG